MRVLLFNIVAMTTASFVALFLANGDPTLIWGSGFAGGCAVTIMITYQWLSVQIKRGIIEEK